MRQDEIVRTLADFGVKTTRQSVARYEEQCLIPCADRSNKGSPGRIAEYPPETIEEFIASYRLMTGRYGDYFFKKLMGDNLSPIAAPSAIAQARLRVLIHETEHFKGNEDRGIMQINKAYADYKPQSDLARMFLHFLAKAWEEERNKARKELIDGNK